MTEPSKVKDEQMWNVWTRIKDNPNNTARYSLVSFMGRTEWRKPTAEKHAREFKHIHGRDAWVRPA